MQIESVRLDGALFPDAIAHPENWPVLRSIDDIRPYVDPGRGIHLFEHGPFLICRYTSSLPETFQTAHDLECRCLVFERESGTLLSRGFHKFFNLGERQSLSDLDLTGGRLELKLDGSMVAALVLCGKVIYHTRGGLSSQSKAAALVATKGHDALVRDAFEAGYTPIFEYTSASNRVVIPYLGNTLTLLALRHRTTGSYNHDLARSLAARHNVALPAILPLDQFTPEAVAATLAKISARTDIEGVVLTLPDGHRLKIKTYDYLRRHKILANIAMEKYVWLCYLEDVLDDTAAALGGERGRALVDFITRLDRRIRQISSEILRDVAPLSHHGRGGARSGNQQQIQRRPAGCRLQCRRRGRSADMHPENHGAARHQSAEVEINQGRTSTARLDPGYHRITLTAPRHKKNGPEKK